MGNDVVIKQHTCKECFTLKIVPLLKASNLYTKDIWTKLDKVETPELENI